MTDPTILPSVALLGIKTLALVGLVLYAIFAGIIVRQEQLMAAVLEEAFEPVLKLLAFIHFLGAVALIPLALFLL